MTAHICTTYKVEYDFYRTNSFINELIRLAHSGDASYLSEDETVIEIPRCEIENTIRDTNDAAFSEYLQHALNVSDADNDFVRFEIF